MAAEAAKSVMAAVRSTPLPERTSSTARLTTICRQADVAKKRAEAKAADPFYPDSFRREEVTGPLGGVQIEREALTGVKVLGAGQFGQVYLAVQSMNDNPEDDVQRAVKLLRDGASSEDKVEFTREAEIMTDLQSVHLPPPPPPRPAPPTPVPSSGTGT